MGDWLADIDWGTAPAWAAVVVASFAALFAYRSMRLTRRAYEKSVHDTHIAQARLVWALAGVHIGKSTGHKSGDMGEKLLQTDGEVIGDHADFYALQDPNDRASAVVMTRSVTIYRVDVTNRSDQPIGHLGIMLQGTRRLPKGAKRPEGGWRWEHRAWGRFGRVLFPQETRTFRMVVPEDSREVDVHPPTVVLSFTDSAGQRWTRSDTRAPKEALSPKQKRFPRLRA